ncbi:MAG: 30S ribosomal protein S24e [Thermoplasmata archaeon]
MDLRILEQRPNPLLHRVEYQFSVTHPEAATPTRDEIRSELAKAAKVPKDRVIIERVRAKFGTAESIGEGSAYETKEAIEVVVPDHIQIRHGLKEKKVKGAAAPAAAEPTPAAPAPKEAAAPEAAEKKESG